jgi:hypothetical protein
MTIIQIDSRFIAPLKCGSRYLRSFGWETRGVSMFNDGWEDFKNLNWEIVILRNPKEHLQSALHTEILSLWNGHTNWKDISEKELIDLFISESGSTHWCGILNKTFFDVCSLKNDNPKILKLENLSSFLSLEGNHLQYRKDDYSFKQFDKWETPEYITNYVRTQYKDQYSIMMDMVNEDTRYYSMFNFLEFNKRLI